MNNAFAVWITGLPASGKSTLAAELARQIRERHPVAVLESDVLRKNFWTSFRYDEEDRERFYGAMAFIGSVLAAHGIAVIFDATANRRAFRDRARRHISRFIEVFVDTPLETCLSRDPKGIYRKAREGTAEHVPGVQAVYEAPVHPEVIVRGDRDSVEESVRRVIAVLSEKGYF